MTKVKTTEELYSQEELQKQFAEATRHAAETDRVEPRAVSASYDKKTARIVLELSTGVVVSIPPGLLQGLTKASPHDLSNVVVSPQGTALHWTTLDADFSVSGLLAGVFGTRAWMAEVGRKGGRATSEAKAAASRANGHKGGRPPKATRDKGSYEPVRNRSERSGAKKKVATPRSRMLARGA
jgi:hypothetical protein